PPLEDRLDHRLLALDEGGRGEPKAGEHRTAEDAVGRRRQGPEPPVAVNEPVDLSIEDPPDDILADPVAAIDVQLLPQVIADAAGRDLRDQFGSPFDVVV